MAGYVMAGSALLGAYGAIQQGQWQKEQAEKQAELDRQAAKASTDFNVWKSDQENTMNKYLAEQTIKSTEAAAGQTYDETVNALRRKAASSIAKGGASGFNINAGSFQTAVGDEYGYGVGEAEKTWQLAVDQGYVKSQQYDLAGKINLEEEKLAQAGYGVAMGKASLLEASGEQARIGSYWTAAAQGARAYGLYKYASDHGGNVPSGLYSSR